MIVTNWSQPAIDPPVVGWSCFALGPPVTRWTEVSRPAPIYEWSVLSSFLPEAHLTAPLLTNSQTFYAPTMIATLAPSLLANAQTFYGPTTTAGLAPSLFTNVQVFYGPTTVQPLSPSLLSNSQTFYGPTLANVLTPALLDNAQAFYAPTTTQNIAGALFTNSQTFFAPLISAPAVTYIGTTSDLTSQTTYTFTGVSIGAAANDRRVVVVFNFGSGSARTVSGITIDGNAATVEATTNPSAGAGSVIAHLAVTTGTTATIVVTLSGAASVAALSVFKVTGLLSGTPVDVDHTVSSTTPTLNMTGQADGILIAGLNAVATGNVTWTGPTEVYDAALSAWQISGATKTGTGTSETVTGAAAGTFRLSAATWR